MTSRALLTSQDLPERFRRADVLAIASQRRHLWVIKTQIVGLLVPVAAGTVDAALSGSQPALAFISVFSLTIVAVTRLLQRFAGYETSWHTSRAVAETIRSLSWQYAAGGTIFAGMSEDEAQGHLRQRIDELDPEDPGKDGAGSGVAVTAGMRAMREEPFEARRSIYQTERAADQLSWYRTKAAIASRRAKLWDWLFVTSAALAIVFGVAQVSGAIEVSLVSLFGLTAAVIGTWTGVNQFGSLQATYSNTAAELQPLFDLMEETSEADWPDLVSSTEEVMAREHSLWLVRRS